jgi:solute carrier family 35 protein E1
MIGTLLLLLPAVSALAFTPMRAAQASMSHVRSAAPSLAVLQPLKSRSALVMQESSEVASVDGAAVPAETCIEDEAVEECVLLKWDAGKLAVPQSLFDTAKLGALFFSWFALNVMYNITNKRCQNAFPMPWTMTVVSLFVGIPWVLFLWATGIRKAPKLNPGAWKVLLPIGAAHALGHAGAVIALGAGAVSFAQTVKAAEPVFTCALAYIVLGTTFKWQVYATLLPIIFGVSLASLKELSFTFKALYGALASNVAFASRAVLSKATMDKPVGENMGAPNLYGILTIIAFTLSLPFALYYEGAGFAAAWATSTAKVGTPWLVRQMALDGLYYYLYNEVAFIALNQVSPVTHSIANTIKRVCIILATVLVFGNKLTTLGAIGSTIAVLGTFGYSLAKGKWK